MIPTSTKGYSRFLLLLDTQPTMWQWWCEQATRSRVVC